MRTTKDANFFSSANDSHLKSSEEALVHLEEVISHVISEAVEYADKPPEERTLPALVRKSVTQPRRSNTISNYSQVGLPSNGTQIMGFGQPGAYGFPQIQNQMQCNPRFTSKIAISPLMFVVQNSALQQSSQRIMTQYNGIQSHSYHAQNAQFHQQYAQAAQQFQLQQQQAQYQMQLQQQVVQSFTILHYSSI